MGRPMFKVVIGYPVTVCTHIVIVQVYIQYSKLLERRSTPVVRVDYIFVEAAL